MIISSYRTAVDAAAIFSETDAQGVITYVNEEFCRLSGYTKEELIGKSHSILKSGVHPPGFFSHMWKTLRDKQVWKGVICNRAKDGHLYWVDSTIAPMLKDNGDISKFVSIRFDISEHRRLIDSLEWRVNRDPLTGILNRFSITTTLESLITQSVESEQSFTIAALDLDEFRSINAMRGRAVGDDLLIKITKRLEGCIGPGDYLARTGADEFVLLLRDNNFNIPLFQRLRGILDLIAAPFAMSSGLLKVTACVGATSFPTDQSDAPTLLHHAEQALYLAKQAQRNSILFFDIASDKETRSRIKAISRLRQALQENELKLYYQPKIDLSNGEIRGFEALIRWCHPEHGIIPPGDFLQEAEQSDLIIEIGEWCIREALKQASLWIEINREWPISVNIAARHFQSPNFSICLAELIQQAPSYREGSLDLEIVETTALHSVEQAAKAISECGKLGVTVSLDDFGTGYSSLIYLQQLRVQTIKIDKSFIRHVHERTGDLKLVRAIINLANDFQLKVIAEGVETYEQANLLRTLGCEVAQGYLFSPAIPLEAIDAWAEVHQYKS